MTTGYNQQMKEPKTDRSFFDAIFWGGVILWAGLFFGADRLGYLPESASAQIWGWIFLGAGAYGLILNLLRSVMETLPNPSIWDYVGGLCCKESWQDECRQGRTKQPIPTYAARPNSLEMN